jgi:hypothetical protein
VLLTIACSEGKLVTDSQSLGNTFFSLFFFCSVTLTMATQTKPIKKSYKRQGSQFIVGTNGPRTMELKSSPFHGFSQFQVK